VRIGDQLIRAGESVIVSLGSANRDDEQFPDGDRLDVHREALRHLVADQLGAQAEATAWFGMVGQDPRLELGRDLLRPRSSHSTPRSGSLLMIFTHSDEALS
jgi:hypothetical protein